MKALRTTIVLCLTVVHSLLAQHGMEGYQFVPIRHDLSQNTVAALAQDQNGFLWIGTRSGLNRYDGINVKTFMYEESDSLSLCNNYVRVLYVTRHNQILVGTLTGGYCVFDERTETFSKLPSDNGPKELQEATISSFYEDEEGNIWIGTERRGLFMWKKSEEHFVHYRHNANDSWGISSNRVTGVVGDGFGNLWVSTWGGGLNLFDQNTKRFIHFTYEEGKNGPHSNIIRCIAKGANDVLWVGMDRGVDRVSYQSNGSYQFEHFDIKSEGGEDPFVLALIEDKSGRLWVGSENHGVCVLGNSRSYHHWYASDPRANYGIKNNSIWSLCEDKNGTIWFGTFNKGLYKLDEDNWKFPSYRHNLYDSESLTHNAVSSFFEDKKGNVWVGTDGGGLDYWEVDRDRFVHYNKESGSTVPNAVLSVIIDRYENVWVGTWQGGVLIKRKESRRFESFTLRHDFNLQGDKENIFAIEEDSKGRIWFAVFRGGLLRYDPANGEFKSYPHDENNPNSISSNLVRHVFEDSQNRIWLGTEGSGLNLLEDPDSDTFRTFNYDSEDSTSISDNAVQYVMEDKEGRIWVGTSGGLNLFQEENDAFKRFGQKDGFADEVIHSMQIDHEGQFWLSTNKGIVRFDPETHKVRNFDLNDGLQSMEFFKNSSYKLSDGTMLFGGVDGFNVIDPDLVSDDFEEPKIYLVDFKISNQSVRGQRYMELSESLMGEPTLELNYNQNDFSIEFSQINFSQTQKNLYAYRLRNYDRDWQDAGNRREAYYTNVPPGEYVFEVKGMDNGGEWSSKQASIHLIIHPPWYASVWAYLLYALFIAGVVFWAFQTMLNRERLQSKLMLEHMELSKMQELDHMKSSFFANISHEFRSPLTLILGPLKAMLESNDFRINREQVSMMLRNAENLLNLINQLLELSKLESGKMRLELVTSDVVTFLKPVVHSFSSLANRNNMAYRVTFPKKEVSLSFDRDKLEKIVVNLLSNAFKYTNDYGRVEFTLVEEEEKVILQVKDDGIGIPEEEQDFIFNRYYRGKDKKKKGKGTGIGLSLTKELVELHHGHIEFRSRENEGAIFEVHLFKGKAHFNIEDFEEPESEQNVQNKVNQAIYELEESVIHSTSSNDSIVEEENKKLPLVLVVEDNADIRTYIKGILEPEYRVIQAEDGSEGIEVAKERIPDLIITDIMMPIKDGYDLCREIKGEIKTSHIPVILLTAKASNDSALDGFEIGADYYITKPFNPKLLSLRVRNALNTRDQIREQLLNKNTFNIEPKNIKIASRDEEFISKAVTIIEENMSNSEFYVDDLGKELGMSRMQLYRKLKGLIGQSANEFIRTIRLKRAAQLIRQNELNISEITYQVGFNDLQYFRDCFKKQFGVNPSEYGQVVSEKTP